MNAIQKYIRDAIIKSAKSGDALTIDSMVEGSGVDHERVVEELDLFRRMGLIEAPGDLAKATAIQMKRLTAHGEIIHQGKLDFARDKTGEVIHLQLEDGGQPALTIGDDTYHVNIQASEDGTYSVEVVECKDTNYETVVFVESEFADAETARSYADNWMQQRETEGYRWEFTHPDIGPTDALAADVALVHTPDALPPYRLCVVYQHVGIENPVPNTVQQDFDTAEEAWNWWAEARRALVDSVYVPGAQAPAWVGPYFVDADILEGCKNRMSYREVRDGGIARPPIEYPSLAGVGGKWVCSQILPGSHEGVVLLAVLVHVVEDCEGEIRFKENGEGYSVTGTKALFVLEGYPEAADAANEFMEQEGIAPVGQPPESPELIQAEAEEEEEEPPAAEPEPTPTPTEQEGAIAEDDPF